MADISVKAAIASSVSKNGYAASNGFFIAAVNSSIAAVALSDAIAIPQSVQTQKVVINTLVYLVYGYYNSSTMKG
jgi:hypothetical protein